MNLDTVRWIAKAHGCIAWMATLGLAAAAGAWAIKGFSERTHRVLLVLSIMATVLVTLAGGLGALLHLPYRIELRQRIFLQSSELGWLFERKEHFAFGAVLLAWCGLAALGAMGGDAAGARKWGKAGMAAYAGSAIFATAASVASAIIAAKQRF